MCFSDSAADDCGQHPSPAEVRLFTILGEERLKNEKLSETGRNILKSNLCMVKELEIKFKEW